VQILAGVGHGVFRQAPRQAFTLLRAFLREVATVDRPATVLRGSFSEAG
jgi:hypothetical protein